MSLLTISAHQMYGTLTQLLVNKDSFLPVETKGPELVRVSYSGVINDNPTPGFWFISRTREYLIPLPIMKRFGLTHPREQDTQQTA